MTFFILVRDVYYKYINLLMTNEHLITYPSLYPKNMYVSQEL